MNHQTGSEVNRKCQYRTKIESYYTGSEDRRMWQGLQTITNYKGKPSHELPSDASLPDQMVTLRKATLNHAYVHQLFRTSLLNALFEASNTEPCICAPAVLDNCVIMPSRADASKTFKQVNIHKAAGPDGLPGCILSA